jgi:hypothetical protein
MIAYPSSDRSHHSITTQPGEIAVKLFYDIALVVGGNSTDKVECFVPPNCKSNGADQIHSNLIGRVGVDDALNLVYTEGNTDPRAARGRPGEVVHSYSEKGFNSPQRSRPYCKLTTTVFLVRLYSIFVVALCTIPMYDDV